MPTDDGLENQQMYIFVCLSSAFILRAQHFNSIRTKQVLIISTKETFSTFLQSKSLRRFIEQCTATINRNMLSNFFGNQIELEDRTPLTRMSALGR